MLDAMDHQRRVGFLAHMDDPLHPEKISALVGSQQVERSGKGQAADGLVTHQAIGANLIAVAVDVGVRARLVMVTMTLPAMLGMGKIMRMAVRGRSKGLVAQPAAHIRRLGDGIVECALEQCGRIEAGGMAIEQADRRIEAKHRCLQGIKLAVRCRAANHVGLGENNRIGNRHLLHAFGMSVQSSAAVDRIEQGDDAAQGIAAGKTRVRHQGVDNRRRIGQTGGLDDQAGKHGYLAPFGSPVKIDQGPADIATDGAAQASRRHLDHDLGRRLEQGVVEGDLAELVDDDGGVGKARIPDQRLQKRRLAGAEKPGEHGDGNGIHAPIPRPHGRQ